MREKCKAFEHVSTYLVKPFFVQREKAKKGSTRALLVKEANHSTPKPFNRLLFFPPQVRQESDKQKIASRSRDVRFLPFSCRP